LTEAEELETNRMGSGHIKEKLPHHLDAEAKKLKYKK